MTDDRSRQGVIVNEASRPLAAAPPSNYGPGRPAARPSKPFQSTVCLAPSPGLQPDLLTWAACAGRQPCGVPWQLCLGEYFLTRGSSCRLVPCCCLGTVMQVEPAPKPSRVMLLMVSCEVMKPDNAIAAGNTAWHWFHHPGGQVAPNKTPCRLSRSRILVLNFCLGPFLPTEPRGPRRGRR